MFSEAFNLKVIIQISSKKSSTKYFKVAKKASIVDSSLMAVKFSHTRKFILHYFHLYRYRILK